MGTNKRCWSAEGRRQPVSHGLHGARLPVLSGRGDVLKNRCPCLCLPFLPPRRHNACGAVPLCCRLHRTARSNLHMVALLASIQQLPPYYMNSSLLPLFTCCYYAFAALVSQDSGERWLRSAAKPRSVLPLGTFFCGRARYLWPSPIF